MSIYIPKERLGKWLARVAGQQFFFEFNELGQLPFQFERLDEGHGIEAAMKAYNA